MQVRYPSRTPIALALALVLSGLALPSVAAAADSKVQFFVDVVYGSGQGNEVDPQLLPMKKKFAKDFTFTSFKQLSNQTVELEGKTPFQLNLPNGTRATFTLAQIDKDVAQVDMTVGKVTSRIELGKKKSIYAAAGSHKQGMLILVVSPITDPKKHGDGK